MTDLLAALRTVLGHEPPRAHYRDAIEPPEPDLYVSDSEAEHMQRAVDSRLAELWSL